MGDIKTDSFVVPVQITENVTTALKQIASTASQGITLGITMESDAGKVISDIHKISNELEKAINSKNFDMDKLLNLNNAIVKLGEFKYTVEGLDVIFNTLTSSVTSLNGAMTEIASIKMDTKQFSAFQNALSSINANVEKIVQKLDGIGTSSGIKKVANEAKEAAAEIKNTTKATEELKQAQEKTAPKVSSPHDKYMGRSFETLNKNLDRSKVILDEVNAAIGDAATRSNDILNAKHLGRSKTVDQLMNKIEAAEKKIERLRTKTSDATGAYEIDLKSQISYWERVILDAENAMSHLQGQGKLSDYDDRKKSIDAVSRSLKNELDQMKERYSTEQKLIQETIQKKKETQPDEWNKYQAVEAEKAAEAQRKQEQLAEKARLEEEKKAASIAENIKEYQNLNVVLDELIAKNNSLNSNDTHVIDGVNESNALEVMISKANEFYQILDSTDKPTEEIHSQLVKLADDLRYLMSTYNSIFDNNRTKSLNNGYGLGAIAIDSSKYDATRQKKQLQDQIAEISKQMRQADNRVQALSGGKNIEELLKEREAQQQIAKAATEAGQAQAQVQNAVQQTSDQAATAAANAEKLEQNIAEATANAEALEQQMTDVVAKTAQVTNANVTGTVSIGNKVPVTGTGGEQLALEKTLRATYNIQQNMVKILSEINAKMVSGANAATASYEQLRAVMTETVNAAKNLGAEEEKQTKKSGNAKINEHYAIMKKNLQEVLRLKKQLPNAGERETEQIKSQIKRLNERARYHQKAVKDANAIIPIRQQEVDILREQAKIQDAINADTRKKAAATAKQDATKKLESSYNATSKTLRSIGSGDMMNAAETATVQNLIAKFKEYDALLATVGNDFEKLSNAQQKEIQESIDKFNQLTQAQKDAFKAGAYNVYNKGGKYKGELTDLSQDSSLSGIKGQVDSGAISRQAALEQIAAATVKARIETVQYDEATGQLTARFKDQQKNLQQITIGFQDVGNATRHNITTVEQYQNAASKMFSGVGKKLKELLRYFSAFTIVMRVINAIKHGVTVVREMNTALTEMKLVTESTTAEMAKAEKQIQQVAATVASTNVDIAKSATDWAKLGYSMSDALELAGVSAKYAKVGFTDVATASENLTATLQAFYSKELSEGLVDAGDVAGTITDKFVLVGNQFASSAEGLGRGMTEAGSALVAANNSLDESLALITAGTTVLQDESETANAVRTISLRLRGTKASQLEDMGETDLTGVIEDASKLYKIVKDMTSVNGKEGVEIFNPDTQAYKSTYEIMLEISKVWDEMTDVQRAGLLETIAGKTRANAAAAILSNGQILEDAYETSMNAAGAADKAMEETMTSIESRINLFKQATETMWQNTISSDLIKGIVDLGTEFVKLTDKVGLFSIALAGVFGFFGAKGQGKHTNQRVSTKYA